jgi:hypothetical protein
VLLQSALQHIEVNYALEFKSVRLAVTPKDDDLQEVHRVLKLELHQSNYIYLMHALNDASLQ